VGALSTLFPLMESRHNNTAAEATRAVWCLIQDETMMGLAMKKGLVPTLFSCLHATSERALYMALRALRELPVSTMGQYPRQSVAQLLVLLSSETEEVVSNALALLAEAAINEASAADVVEVGGLKPLMSLLERAGEINAREGELDAGELATLVLERLSGQQHTCSHSIWLKNQIVTAGAVPRLVTLLCDTKHGAVASHAARVLANLSTTESYRNAIMKAYANHSLTSTTPVTAPRNLTPTFSRRLVVTWP